MRSVLVLAFLTTFSGCFAVDVIDGALKCNAEGECPTGYYCASTGTCYQNGHTSPTAEGDLALPPESTADLATTPDLTSPCGDTQSDPKNCGSCGHDCTMLPNVTGQGVSCSAGECVVPASACAVGFAHCSSNVEDGCETDLAKPEHCGSCTNACAANTPLCSSMGGTFSCIAMCAAPTADRCGSQCVNLMSDANNCKTCGNVCTFANASATCNAGKCQQGTCDSGYKDCKNGPSDGCETYVMGSDKTNCGDCGNVCSFANAGATCNAGACQIGACSFGYADCKNGPADGCETSIQNDPNNCNGCNKKCALTESCASAACGKTDPVCGSGCDSTCVLPAQFSVDGNIAIDYVHGKKLWQRGILVGQSADQGRISCKNLNLDGVTGWRLPTVAEWREIAIKCGGLNAGNPGTCAPCVDQAAFPNNAAHGYWTADTAGSGVTLTEYTYDTFSGRSSRDDPTSAVPVKCIHDPI
jgi:hypothetical protein